MSIQKKALLPSSSESSRVQPSWPNQKISDKLYDFCRLIRWSPHSDLDDPFADDDHPKSTAFSRSILERIYALVWQEDEHPSPVPWYSSELEVEIAKKLGLDVFEWESEMAKTAKYGYRDVNLSKDIRMSYMPLLPDLMFLIGNEQVQDVVERFLPLYPDVQFFAYEEPDNYAEEKMIQPKIAVPSQRSIQVKSVPFRSNSTSNIGSSSLPVSLQAIQDEPKPTKEIKIDPTKKRFGFLLNTSSGQGSHWVAFFVDITQDLIECFDPLGMAPSEKFKKFNKVVRVSLKKHFPNITKTIFFSNEMVQQTGYDCGIYCTHFLVYRIRNQGTLKSFLKTDLSAQSIHEYRQTYWNMRSASSFFV